MDGLEGGSVVTTAIKVLPDRVAFSLKEIAGPIVPCSVKTLIRESNAGNLVTFKLRGRRLVRREDLDAYLASLDGSAQ